MRGQTIAIETRTGTPSSTVTASVDTNLTIVGMIILLLPFALMIGMTIRQQYCKQVVKKRIAKLEKMWQLNLR
ncbi:MAG: hypothetical protein KME16_17125 [Scytolyngbya sp. HA4215-MV1]|nr:hypothetical protein [Scytolyngbya sp. HA4215-MV1]